MTRDLFLRRKWTLRAHGEKVVFVKRANERREHVLMKALLWALYLPDYPDLRVEVPVDDRYKPDLVALDAWGHPRFWAEAGHVSPDKVWSLMSRYRKMHLAMAKWDTPLAPFAKTIREGLRQIDRQAPVDLILFPRGSNEQFISPRGEIDISPSDVERLRLA